MTCLIMLMVALFFAVVVIGVFVSGESIPAMFDAGKKWLKAWWSRVWRK